MTDAEDRTAHQIVVTNSTSRIAFSRPEVGTGQRYLVLDGKPAYDVGINCDTCPLSFERLEGANSKVSPKEASDRLRAGVKDLDDPLVELLANALPDGKYIPTIREVAPQLIRLGSEDDYFWHEQIALWGIDGFWGLPEYPHVAYYRTRSIAIGDRTSLFEFVVPMFPSGWLDSDTERGYEERLRRGDKPTAWAVSVIDVRQPAMWQGDPEINKHVCVVHYLLDGHHKTFAASQTSSVIELLSFVAVDVSLAQQDEVLRVAKM